MQWDFGPGTGFSGGSAPATQNNFQSLPAPPGPLPDTLAGFLAFVCLPDLSGIHLPAISISMWD